MMENDPHNIVWSDKQHMHTFTAESQGPILAISPSLMILSTKRQGGPLSCSIIIITILVLHVCVFYFVQKNKYAFNLDRMNVNGSGC